MAKEPVKTPKVNISWGIDHYAGVVTPVSAPVVDETPVEDESASE
jgi:hypothetical protein